MKAVDDRGIFREVYGVDISISMCLVGQRYLEGRDRCKLELTGGTVLDFGDQQFDFAFSYTVFQHMLTKAIIHRNLCEIHRVLKPGGLARVQTVASGDSDPRDAELYDGRVFRDGEEFWREFEQVGFERVKVETGLTHERHIWVTARRP